MRKPLAAVFAALALAAFAETVPVELGRGITVPEYSDSVGEIERIEAVTLNANSTLTVKLIRGLVDIPYMDHRTNDASVTEGVVTEGTTFDRYAEAFSGPLRSSSGTYLDVTSQSCVYRVSASVLQFYGFYETVNGTSGYTPCVYYSFPSNALYVSEVKDYPDKWTYFGTPGEPGPHQYVSDLTVRTYNPYKVWHSGAAIVSHAGYTSASWVDVYTTNVTQQAYQLDGDTFYGPVTNVTVSTVAEYVGGTTVTNWLNETADDLNPYSAIVFAGVEMPSSLTVNSSGATQPITFVPGHVVTNFAVWSAVSLQATNVIWSATLANNTIVSTNFNGTAGYVLPGDRFSTEGTALPAGQVKLYLKNGK